MRTSIFILAMTLVLSIAGAASAQTLGSGFTYQGTFADNGTPANGSYDFEFALYPVAAGGDALQISSQTNVAVNGGLVNTMIDFGAAAFNGTVKFVEVRVRPAGSLDPYEVLSPRQALTGVPYALGLPMPFHRTVSTGAVPAFVIASSDGGTAVEGIVLNPNSTFPAVSGRSYIGVAVQGTALSAGGVAVNGVSEGQGTGVRGQCLGETLDGNNCDGVRGLSSHGIGVHGVGVVGGWFQGGLQGVRVDARVAVGSASNHLAVVNIHNFGDNGSVGNLINASVPTPGDPAANHVFRVDGVGRVFADGGYSTGGADVAEYVPATESLEPGDVAEIDAVHGKALRKSSRANSSAVAGVVSTQPGLTLNGSMSEQETQKGMPRLALVGRVPVKTTNENGAIHAGDLLVSASRPGHAMRALENPLPGTVIGKAMESLEDESGVIEMLVMLR
jgi:hypothetical protein